MKRRWIPFIAIAAMLSISSLATADETEIDFEAYISEDDSAEMVVAAEDEEALFEEDGFIEDLEAADGEVEGVPIDEAHFPDQFFRKFISETCDSPDSEGSKDGVLSEEEIAAITAMSLYSSSQSNLEGIQYLTSLSSLSLHSLYSLKDVDLTGCSSLINLYLNNCQFLSSLDVSGVASLKAITCEGNFNSSNPSLINASNCISLSSINLEGRYVSLNVNNCPSLTELAFWDGPYQDISAVNCSALTKFSSDSRINNLDLSNCTSLTTVDCGESRVSNINLQGCTQLTSLAYSGNITSNLDFSSFPNLESLSIMDNDLSSLDVSMCPRLKTLQCQYQSKKLTSLNIKNCEMLETCLFNYTSYYRRSEWFDDLGACYYELYMYSNGDTTYKLYYDSTAEIITSRGTFPAYSTPETIRNALNSAPAPTAAVSEQITISKKPTNKKPSVSKNKITVNWSHFKQTKKTKAVWKKIKKVQVQCATDKGFSNIVKSTMVGKKKTKAVIKGLAKKTTYYVRVRYFDGTGYSAWSGVKKIKTK